MLNWLQNFTNTTIRHILFNYSASEIGVHHPSLPCGVVFRDQGQADLYSGKARLILTTNGNIALIGKTVGLSGEYISLIPKDIKNFRILGKHFEKKTFDQTRKLTSLKEAGVLEKYTVIDPITTFVDPNTYKIINSVPLTSVLESFDLFEVDPMDKSLPSPDIEIHNLIKGYL